ncbi:hypothetical protein Tco_1326315 [Tanacetum coccineum]
MWRPFFRLPSSNTSLDYVPGPEHPPSPDYVPDPEDPEQAPLSLDYPLPDDASPTAPSPGYVADSDSEEVPEEDLEEDPNNYLADRGDDVTDESSDDNDNDDDDDDDDDDVEEDEEEHLAPADSSVVPVKDPVPSTKDTEAFNTDESAPIHEPSPRRRMARMSVRPQIPISDTTEVLIVEYASAPTPPSPPPSLLSPLSSPLPQIPSPPLPLPSPPTTSLTYAEHQLGYKAARFNNLPEADMPLRKIARFTAPTGRFEVGESSLAAAARQAGHTLAHTVDHGFIDTM